MTRTIREGDRFVAFRSYPARCHLFKEVIEVARDGAWADLRVCNAKLWWTQRLSLPLHESAVPYPWTQADLVEQAEMWDGKAKRRKSS